MFEEILDKICDIVLSSAGDHLVSLAHDHLLPLLKEAFNMIKGVPKEIEDMKEELERIEDFINKKHRISDDAEEDKSKHEIKATMKQLIVASFHIEDVIDEYMICEKQPPGCAKLFKTMILHLQIAYKIHGIKSQMSEIDCAYEKYHLYRNPSSSEKGSSSSAANRKDTKLYNLKEAPRSINKVDLVGIKKPRNKLIDWLVKGREQLTVVSVVGMRGLGKTTLAKIVFDNPKVVKHFDCRVWIKQSRDILLEIFQQQRKYPPQSLHHMDRKPLVDKVRNYLQGKRYVVVFDDVLNTYFWSEIEFVFPDNQNGSRILITTTKMDVAENFKRSLCVDVHEMQPLTLAKSSLLLNKMAFRDLQGNCPEKLTDICLEIVKKCKGLPLAITAIGDVLSSTKNRSTYVWYKFSEKIYSEMIRSGRLSGITQILCSAFDDLPFNLKPCLLYFAMFPEDYEVKSKRLIRHWIAEGFIKHERGRTSEEVAEGYLEELIDKCLVQTSTVSFDGKVEGVRVHNLYLVKLREKASDICFSEFVTNHGRSLCGIIRRLSIATTSNDLIEQIESSHVRSLLFFLEEEVAEYLVMKIPTKYKLLKILDFENAKSLVVPENIGDLIHLRYLSFRNTEVKTLPKSIGKLQNLETFDLRQTAVNEIPKEIGKFSKLRHLLGNTMSLSQLKECLGGMESLQTLSEVKIDEDGIELITELGKLRQLKKLSLSDVREEQGTNLCSSINQMHHLEKLYIETKSKDVPIDLSSLSDAPMLPKLQKLHLHAKLKELPGWILKLHFLVELSLSYSWLTVDPLELLKYLSNLLVLNLEVDSYNGKLLHFQSGGLWNLKELGLRYLSNLESISIEEGALQSLKELTFMNIPNLKTEPSGIKHLANLEVLNTYFMPTEFEKSIAPLAKLIKEKSLDYEKRRY